MLRSLARAVPHLNLDSTGRMSHGCGCLGGALGSRGWKDGYHELDIAQRIAIITCFNLKSLIDVANVFYSELCVSNELV